MSNKTSVSPHNRYLFYSSGEKRRRTQRFLPPVHLLPYNYARNIVFRSVSSSPCPWCKVVLEKLIIAQLVKKFLAYPKVVALVV
jgi:hypothetical protein